MRAPLSSRRERKTPDHEVNADMALDEKTPNPFGVLGAVSGVVSWSFDGSTFSHSSHFGYHPCDPKLNVATKTLDLR